MDILLDASAIIAVIADEPEAQIIINCTKGAEIISPNIIPSINNETKTNTGKSPLEDIPRIKLNVTTPEIVGILQECRAGV